MAEIRPLAYQLILPTQCFTSRIWGDSVKPSVFYTIDPNLLIPFDSDPQALDVIRGANGMITYDL